MLGLHVSVPVACFRKGMAREYLETEMLPPPATCYGFLLSMVGETDRKRHIGARVTAGLLNEPDTSVVLRTVWRVKKQPLGSSGNTRPDYQQLLTGIEIVLWLDSSEEASQGPRLEDRVREALDPARRSAVCRFGGLSLGESTHLVDSVLPLDRAGLAANQECRLFLTAERGRLTLPVWVDHIGSAGTRHVVGNLEKHTIASPEVKRLPVISPGASS